MEKVGQSSLPIFVVDAFSKHAFQGNGAAVCPLEYQSSLASSTKQKIAAEMNLSETAFISIISEEDSFKTGKCFGLEWFTPTCQVPLCGHATLASAHVLFSVYGNQSSVLEFQTLSGTLRAKRLPDGGIEMVLPAYQSEHVVWILPNLLALLKEQLQELKPNPLDMLAAKCEVVGVIVTLKGSTFEDCTDDDGNHFDFISRYFAPWLGVNEDPVTGSAHSVLAPFWSKLLNKNELFARQCSLRGGNLKMRVTEDSVAISAYAHLFLQGHIRF